MSLALPAALLLILALPGFIFVYSYRGSLRPQNDVMVSSESMSLGWILGLIGAVVSHAVWVPLANGILHFSGSDLSADIDSIAYLLAGEYKEGFDTHVQPLIQHPYLALCYFGSLYLVAGLAGTLLHNRVRALDLDRKYAILRFDNPWHYLFFPTADSIAVITVTCQHKDYTCLYAGILQSYQCTSSGELDRLVLLNAARAQLQANTVVSPMFTEILGDKFLIWCRDINTLNIEYKTTAEFLEIIAQSARARTRTRAPTTLAEAIADRGRES